MKVSDWLEILWTRQRPLRPRKRRTTADRRRPTGEPLETRVCLSADPLSVTPLNGTLSNDWVTADVTPSPDVFALGSLDNSGTSDGTGSGGNNGPTDPIFVNKSQQAASTLLVSIQTGHTVDELHDLLARSARTFEYLAYTGILEVHLADGVDIDAAYSQFEASAAVASVELDYAIALQNAATPNDSYFYNQWGLNQTSDIDIDAPEAWSVTTGSDDVVVAVIDTGIDYNHPDLINNIWVNPGEIAGNGVDDDGNGYVDDIHGYDFFDNDGDPMDIDGHGTHVSGIIGATGDNGLGVSGVAQHVKLMALRFLGPDGGFTSDAVRALNYAVANGATVSNNSWGGGGYSTTLRNAIATARNAGHIFVAAAGNNAVNNDNSPHYPSNYTLDNLISVAASDRYDQLASFSNYGVTSVDLVAPGLSILSTTPNNTYSYYSGTSMAAPFVTGTVALVQSQHPDWTYNQVIHQILSTVDPVAAFSGKVASGGRLNAANAVGYGATVSDDHGDSIATATKILPFGTLTAQISDDGDVDFFAFDAVKGGSYRISTMLGTMEDSTLTLYSSSGQQIAYDDDGGTGYASAINFKASASGTYYVKVASVPHGGLGTYNFSISTSRFIQSGQSLVLTGSTSTERINFEQVGNGYQVTIGPASYFIPETLTSSLVINTGNADSVLRIFGTAANETATLKPHKLIWENGDFRLTGNSFSRMELQGGGGFDTATFYDSAGNDYFVATATESWLGGNGFLNYATDFDPVAVSSAAGGSHGGRLFDTTGDDTFIATPTFALLTGDRLSLAAHHFERARAVASTGHDTAAFYDSAGNDYFYGLQSESWLGGDGFFNHAIGFDSVVANATAGGYDRARLYDSAGNDTLTATPTYALLVGRGLSLTARQFERVDVRASAGYDTASLYDSAGNDYFVSYASKSWLGGNGFLNYTTGFDSVNGYATAGGYDSARLYDSAGDDTFVGRSDVAWMQGATFVNYATGFERVAGVRVHGGYDRAYFFDTAGNDVFESQQNLSTLTMRGRQLANATGFQYVEARFTKGGTDQTIVDGLRSSDAVAGYGSILDVSRNSYWLRVRNVQYAQAIATDNQTPRALLSKIDFVFEQLGSWL